VNGRVRFADPETLGVIHGGRLTVLGPRTERATGSAIRATIESKIVLDPVFPADPFQPEPPGESGARSLHHHSATELRRSRAIGH
jgi:hypothetical protein